MNELKLIEHYAEILNKLGNRGGCADTSETQPSWVNIPFHTHFEDQGQLLSVMDNPAYERPSGSCLL